MSEEEKSHYSIQELPEAERPRERLLRHGSEALSTAELIAVVLGSGIKNRSVLELSQLIISHFGGLQQLARATIQELCEVKGIGPTKALQLHAVFSLGMRLSKNEIDAKYKIEHPVHVYNLVKDKLQGERREVFIAILQDIKGYLVSQHVVSIGSLTQALVHPREVFCLAIRHRAVSLILVHNHPSGDLSPSASDIALTKTLIDAGGIVGIPINDHLIISDKGYASMRQNGDLDFQVDGICR